MSDAVPRAGDLAADFLPHGPPFVLLDRILAIDDERGRFSKCVSRNDPLLAPAGALSPLLMIEAMAQAAGLVLMRREPELRARGIAVLAAIDRCEVTGSARAGDVLIVEIAVARRYADVARIRGEAFVEERRCATATLTLAFAPRSIAP